MALRGDREEFEPAVAVSDATTTAWPPHVAFASLGPVLLVRSPLPLSTAVAQLSVRLDSFGLNECLDGDGFRLYRLPESDFLGWERLASRLPWSERAGVGATGDDRRAGVVCGQPNGWSSVTRLSALGWDVCREILRCERARLCAAVWRDL
jgi:hypothetical protein